MHMHTRTCTCTHTHAHTNTNTHTHTHTHTHAHAHAHAHAPVHMYLVHELATYKRAQFEVERERRDGLGGVVVCSVAHFLTKGLGSIRS